jgi:hypothetical protein
MDTGFIEQSIDKHKNKYNYELVEYKNNKTKVKIVCPIHNIFEQQPYKHKKGQGCPLCTNNIKKTTELFIEDAKKIHGDKYDYSLVEYKNNSTKVKIICLEHGIFEQNPNNHISKEHGCSFCNGGIKYNKDIFIRRSKEVHGDKYDYSLVNYINSHTKVRIICPIHGEFKQTPSCHTNHKYGCPVCSESRGEKEIRNILDKHDINYIYQKQFSGCRFKYPLKFDFYLPKYNTCVEYNGIQHYNINEFFGGYESLIYSKKRDKIKIDFCENNNISLLVIKYNDNNIKNKLLNFIRYEKHNRI